MAHDVFISYSTRDKATADEVCARLEAARLRCWIAPRDILPGMEWGEGIIDGINRSRVMVLVFSSNANASPQIRREVERAVHKGLPIIPFRIEDVFPSRSLEYFLSSPHWLDALTPPVESHIGRLVDGVRAMLEKLDGTERTVIIPQPPRGKVKKILDTVLGKPARVVETVPVEGLAAPPGGPWPEGAPPPRARPVAVLIALCVFLAMALVAVLVSRPPSAARAAAVTAVPTAALPPPPTATIRAAAETATVVSAEEPPPSPSAARARARTPAAPMRVAATYECRLGVKFSIDPDKATVSIDGRRIGIADDFYHHAYTLSRSGTHYARLSSRGYRTEYVKIVVRPSAEDDNADVKLKLRRSE